MSFLLACPICGPRDVYEFRWGGEILKRPQPDAEEPAWVAYRYLRANPAGAGKEWWFHRLGCRRWFQGERDTTDNVVIGTWFAGEDGHA